MCAEESAPNEFLSAQFPWAGPEFTQRFGIGFGTNPRQSNLACPVAGVEPEPEARSEWWERDEVFVPLAIVLDDKATAVFLRKRCAVIELGKRIPRGAHSQRHEHELPGWVVHGRSGQVRIGSLDFQHQPLGRDAGTADQIVRGPALNPLREIPCRDRGGALGWRGQQAEKPAGEKN